MKEQWNVSLNTNISYSNGSKIIGKNVVYIGNEKMLYKSGNITVIGYAKIYNEFKLWKMLQEKETGIEMPKTEHSLCILVELYKRFGYEDMLELLEGDFSFVLLDYNIYGEESWLYVARDPFGLYPLYYCENPSIDSKKVQFEMETKQFGFSSTGYVDNMIYRSFIAGSYQRFSHSFKVSAIWKQNYRPRPFYKLPFFSIYHLSSFSSSPMGQLSEEREGKKEREEKKEREGHIKKQLTNAIKKRIDWIYDKNPTKNIKIGVLYLSPSSQSNSFLFEMFNKTIKEYLEQEQEQEQKQDSKFEYVPVIPEMIQNADNSSVFEWSKIASFSNEEDKKYDMNSVLQIEYIEKEYPTIITRLKLILNSNDPYIIRSHFIPMIFAKYLSEKMPEVKHVFLAEPFTYDWIDKKYLERRKKITQIYLDENMKGWTQLFLAFGIELYMPFLDRVLIQKIEPSSFV